MRYQARKVRELLGSLDPAEPRPLASADQRKAILVAILDRSEPTNIQADRRNIRVTGWRRPLSIGTAVAAVVVAVAVFLTTTELSPQPARAVTPAPLSYSKPAGRPSVSEVIGSIASRVERIDESPAARYEHLRTRGWSLSSRIDGRQVTSAVIPEQREFWRAADLSGRSVTRRLAPIFRSERDRRTWEHQGSPGRDTTESTRVYEAGDFATYWPDTPPSDEAGMRTWLARGHPAENGPAETLVAIADVYRERVLRPQARSAILRDLAAVQGLTYDGAVLDRAGREGEAFSVISNYSGLPTRYTLIIDGRSGRLLGYEETLTTEAGRLNVEVPAVIEYTVYLDADYSRHLP